MVEMVYNIHPETRRLICFISAFMILWMGVAASFAYEMGKHGIHSINWSFVLWSNIPVLIIAGALMFLGFRKKDR